MAESGPFKLDPEVEAILRRIGADPKSGLLRVPRPRAVRVFFDGRPQVSAGAPLLSTAERHLLRVHRNEVAQLLREACKTKLIDGPGGRLYVSPYQTTLREHERWNPEELATRVHDARREGISVAEVNPAWSLLEACVREPFGNAPTVTQLAEASLRLEPSDDARIMAGLDLTQHGAAETTIEMLAGVLEAPSSESVALCTRNNIGMAYSFLEEMKKAHENYVAACYFREDRLEPWMNRLILAIQLGLVADATAAAEALDALAPNSLPAVELFAESKEWLREHGNWSPSHHSRDSIRRLESRLGIASRRIVAMFGPIVRASSDIDDATEAPRFRTGTGILPKNHSMRMCRLVS